VVLMKGKQPCFHHEGRIWPDWSLLIF
jgi:hypothetical protein